MEQYNGLVKTILKAIGGGTFKHWDLHLAKATWLINTRQSINQAGPTQSKHPCAYEECVREEFGLVLPQGKTNPFMGLFLLKDSSSLVGNAEGWGNTTCTSMGFDFWVRRACHVELYNIGCWMTLPLYVITQMDCSRYTSHELLMQ